MATLWAAYVVTYVIASLYYGLVYLLASVCHGLVFLKGLIHRAHAVSYETVYINGSDGEENGWGVLNTSLRCSRQVNRKRSTKLPIKYAAVWLAFSYRRATCAAAAAAAPPGP